MRRLTRFLPGASGFPLRGDSSFAARTNASRRSFGTAMTPRMTALKCWNSGVLSKDGSFINLPKRACACRAPASSCSSGTHLCLALRFAGQFIVSQPASDNLRHDQREPLRVRHLAIVKAEALLIGIGLKVEWFDAYIRAFQCTLEQAPKVLQSIRVNVLADICFRVVDHFMRVFRRDRTIGLQFVRVDARSFFDILNDLAYDMMAFAPTHNFYAGFSVAL